MLAALGEYHLSDCGQQVKDWYDGFTFGSRTDIYNPWSIIHFLDKKKVGTYWANSSSNSLAGSLIQGGSPEIKMTMESLLKGENFETSFDEQVVFDQLDQGENAVWSLLLASGYLKVVHYEFNVARRKPEYVLKLTNLEVQVMFEQIIGSWFGRCRGKKLFPIPWRKRFGRLRKRIMKLPLWQRGFPRGVYGNMGLPFAVRMC